MKSLSAMEGSTSKDARQRKLTSAMLANQKTGQPVHQWPTTETAEPDEWEHGYRTIEVQAKQRVGQRQRDAGEAEAVVREQLAGSVPDAAENHEVNIAYEPIWAIGTGRTPTSEEIAAMHAAIRNSLVERFGERGMDIRILYGGSLKPQNAREILSVENVNGGLVGGASLLANDFYTIISAV